MEPEGHREQWRDDDGHGEQGQQGVESEEDDRDHDQGEPLEGELTEAVLEQLLEVLDVAGHPGHDDAGLLLGVEVEAEPLEVREDSDPQVVHDSRGEAPGDLDLGLLGQGADADDDEIDDSAPDHHREGEVAGGHSVVDGVGGEGRAELAGDGDDDDEQGRPDHEGGVLGEQGDEREALLLVGGRERGEV